LSLFLRADVAQLVEHVLGKDGVSGSIPLIGSRDSVRSKASVGNNYQMIQSWIDMAFDPSLDNAFRNKVEGRLPSLKTGGTYKALDKVLEHLDDICQGGPYADGGQPPSIKKVYPSLSDAEKANLNAHYLTKVREFEVSLRQSPGN
jgi:hypothetical protein